jgi:glycosyltransferase involved in cell wall biosynthesis
MENSAPKISVAVISYNFERFLKECLDSILSQTLKPFEIIVCDDCSSDGSWSIITEYRARYPTMIKAYRHERNMGSFYNGTFGGKACRGDFISLLDGDDRWLPRKLELEWRALSQYPEAQVAYSNVITIDAHGNRTGVWCDRPGPVLPIGDVFIEVFSRRFFPNSGSVFRNELVSRAAFDLEGHIDERLENYWDWDRKIRYTSRFKVAYSGEALVEYRKHGGGISNAKPDVHFRAMSAIYEKYLPLLEKRSRKDSAKVRCHVELLLAEMQRRVGSNALLTRYTVENVYERCTALYHALPYADREVLKGELSPVFRKLLLRMAIDAFAKLNISQALRCLWESRQYGPETPNPMSAPTPFWRRLFFRLHNAYRNLRDGLN